MKKIVVALLAVCMTVCCSWAAVTISVSSKTVQKTGGGGTITVSGTGEWTAVSDSNWITVKSGASGTGDGKVIFTVTENTTADTRIGHITITGGNTYTITQYGYTGSLKPSSVTTDLNGTTGTLTVTVDAGISWTAVPNVDWLSATPASGISVGTVTYTVAPYNGVVTRVGSITIAGKTFEVTQTGVDVNIEPKSTRLSSEADLVQVTVTALASTKWTVTPNATWISVLDKESGYGDYVLTLAVNANPSFERRTGTVSIGTATLTIMQEGKDTAVLAIDPEEATAAASGAYGNIAVYATPDAPWTAKSLTSWLVISEGEEGAGNGNIKYVVSANPTLEERQGVITVTPPYKTPDPDIYAGLVCRVLDQSNCEGIESRSFDHSLNTAFDGSFSSTLQGTAFPAKDKDDLTVAFNFKVGELGRVNRLIRLNWLSVYLDEQNRLCIHGDETKSDWSISAADHYYTLVVRFDDETHQITAWIGDVGGALNCIAQRDIGNESVLDFSSAVATSNIELGHTVLPTEGYLTSGQIQDFRFWTRALSDDECAAVELNKDTMVNGSPRYKPTDMAWHYFPFDGSCYGTQSASSEIQANATATNWVGRPDRFGYRQRALYSTGSGMVNIANFSDLFEGSSKLNRGQDLAPQAYRYRDGRQDSSSYYYWRYYPYEATTADGSNVDASWSFWLYLDEITGEEIVILSRNLVGVGVAGDKTWLANSAYATDKTFKLSVMEDGILVLSHGDRTKQFTGKKITEKTWHMITLVGVATKSVRLYIDGNDAGNDTSVVTMGFLPATDRRLYYDEYNYTVYHGYVHEMRGSVYPINATLSIGGFDGCFDDFSVFEGALTSEQVRSLYEAERAKVVYHTVTQGVQVPTLDAYEGSAPAEGDNLTVKLTLAQNVNWTAASNCDWLQITSGDEGAGSATIEIAVEGNPTVVSRTGTVTIAGLTYTVVQEGLLAEVEPDKTFFESVESDMGSISVYTEGAGQWTAVSNDDWIQIDPDSDEGNGAGTCWFFIDDYPLTTQSRTGSITIAGKTVYITQCGYKLSIDPAIAEVGSNAGAGEIGVAASIDQVWEVISDCDWITITSGRSGLGNGKVQYQFTDNTTGETRTGTIIIGGQKYTLTQCTTVPLVTKANGEGTITGSGQYSQGTEVTLTATPKAGYVFSHWQGDAVGVSNKVTVAMDLAKNVEAVFIPESAAEQLAAEKAAQGGFYTRDQIHNLEVGNLVLDVDSATGKARIGVQLQETSDLSNPNWKAVNVSSGDLDIGSDGTVGIKASVTGNAKFFRVVTPSN